MNLLYYLIGKNQQLYNQCYFSIFSFLQYNEIDKIYIYTDSPAFFQNFDDRVSITIVTDEQKRDWLGSANDIWRVKLKVIEDLAQKTNAPFLYADTDTFLYKPLAPVIEGLKQGKAYLHVSEGRVRNKKHSIHRMWKATQNTTLAGVLVKSDLHMWNAGIIALPPEKRLEIVRLALAINDAIRNTAVRCSWTEQYSVSIAVDNMCNINSCDAMIGHYWGNKPDWDSLINKFLLQQYLEGNSLEQSVAQFKQIDLLETPYFKHISSTKLKIIKLLDKIFTTKSIAIHNS